jgi:ribosomal protein S18 acetylase RimI-like enzyme
MGLTYFKRYRMEIDLGGMLFRPDPLPNGYELVPWNESLTLEHAAVKYECFCLEMDAIVFPCLGDREGCQRLMREISAREGFVPQATWLLSYTDGSRRRREYCGTVQGVRDGSTYGAIQNLGITPSHRGQGLGTALLYAALTGFREKGIARVYLEVTAQNIGAVRLYQRLGFRRMRTVYKAAEVAYA